MIVEHAVFTVSSGQVQHFEERFSAAQKILSSAEGYCWSHLFRVTEQRNRFVLLVGWVSRDHHLVDFAASGAYRRWHDMIVPLLGDRTQVTHLEPCGPFDVSDAP